MSRNQRQQKEIGVIRTFLQIDQGCIFFRIPPPSHPRREGILNDLGKT